MYYDRERENGLNIVIHVAVSVHRSIGIKNRQGASVSACHLRHFPDVVAIDSSLNISRLAVPPLGEQGDKKFRAVRADAFKDRSFLI